MRTESAPLSRRRSWISCADSASTPFQRKATRIVLTQPRTIPRPLLSLLFQGQKEGSDVLMAGKASERIAPLATRPNDKSFWASGQGHHESRGLFETSKDLKITSKHTSRRSQASPSVAHVDVRAPDLISNSFRIKRSLSFECS